MGTTVSCLHHGIQSYPVLSGVWFRGAGEYAKLVIYLQTELAARLDIVLLARSQTRTEKVNCARRRTRHAFSIRPKAATLTIPSERISFQGNLFVIEGSTLYRTGVTDLVKYILE